MVLADTCLWIDFFHSGDAEMSRLLLRGEVVTHWIIIGELATGNLSDRNATLMILRDLDRLEPATEREALVLIENQRLYGLGLSWGDVQLLAACLIQNVRLWTRDRRLRAVAERLNCAWAEV